jgi:hypothetical protein
MTIASVATSGIAQPMLGRSMYSSQLFAVTLAVVLLVTLDAALYTYGGAPLAMTTTTASVFSLIGWRVTNRRQSASDAVAFNTYIATVVALVVLYAEQWHGGFASRLVQLYPRAYPPGVGITDHAFVAVFPLAGSALLLIGALTYYHGTAFGRFAAWFTFAWGAVAALAVYVYPLFADRMSTVPGMLTAPLPLLVSLLGLRTLTRSAQS